MENAHSAAAEARRGKQEKETFQFGAQQILRVFFSHLRPRWKNKKGDGGKNKMLLSGRRPRFVRPFQTAVQHAHRIQQQPWGE